MGVYNQLVIDLINQLTTGETPPCEFRMSRSVELQCVAFMGGRCVFIAVKHLQKDGDWSRGIPGTPWQINHNVLKVI